MSTNLLGPMLVGLVAILSAPALLFATSLLEHLIASPVGDRSSGRQTSDLRRQPKGR
jgi:hypothetical protein